MFWFGDCWFASWSAWRLTGDCKRRAMTAVCTTVCWCSPATPWITGGIVVSGSNCSSNWPLVVGCLKRAWEFLLFQPRQVQNTVVKHCKSSQPTMLCSTSLTDSRRLRGLLSVHTMHWWHPWTSPLLPISWQRTPVKWSFSSPKVQTEDHISNRAYLSPLAPVIEQIPTCQCVYEARP